MEKKLIAMIERERERQVNLGYNREHDKLQSAEQWQADLNVYMEKLKAADAAGQPYAVRERAIQVAAIAVAMLEVAEDRLPRQNLDERFG